MRSRFLHHLFSAALCCLLLLLLPFAVHAETAEDVTSRKLITGQQGNLSSSFLVDRYLTDSVHIDPGSWFTIEREEGFGSLYFMFDLETGGYTVTNNDTGESARWGEEGFLHDFVDLEGHFGAAPKSVTVTFEDGAKLVEMYFFSSGETPDFVQKWELCADGAADMLLMPTHSDDEQLFLGGILPLYAGERDYTVQVAYFTDHRNLTNRRCREALNGLWAVGCKTYPVFGPYPDLYSEAMNNSYRQLEIKGITEDMLVDYAIDLFRKYQPSVVVTHDLKGEYGHGQHMVYADMVMKAAQLSADAQRAPESAEQYGPWEVPKVYLHLWPENPIVLDLDQPLDRFDGKSAFLVTKELGFPAHVTQYQEYAWYMYGKEKATEITKFSPCVYGLYYTAVGPDEAKDDFFEHISGKKSEPEVEPSPEETEPEIPETEPETQPIPTEETVAPTAAPEILPSETAPEASDGFFGIVGNAAKFGENRLFYISFAAAIVLLIPACVAAAKERKKASKK